MAENMEKNMEELEAKGKEVVEKLSKKAEPVVKSAKKTASTAKKKATEAKKSMEEGAKTAKKKAAASTLKAADKIVPEKVLTFVQYHGREYDTKDLVAQAKKMYEESGSPAGVVRSVHLYIKPEDNAAYYVINESSTGAIQL